MMYEFGILSAFRSCRDLHHMTARCSEWDKGHGNFRYGLLMAFQGMGRVGSMNGFYNVQD
jgi:hypothetical protein